MRSRQKFAGQGPTTCHRSGIRDARERIPRQRPANRRAERLASTGRIDKEDDEIASQVVKPMRSRATSAKRSASRSCIISSIPMSHRRGLAEGARQDGRSFRGHPPPYLPIITIVNEPGTGGAKPPLPLGAPAGGGVGACPRSWLMVRICCVLLSNVIVLAPFIV